MQRTSEAQPGTLDVVLGHLALHITIALFPDFISPDRASAGSRGAEAKTLLFFCFVFFILFSGTKYIALRSLSL